MREALERIAKVLELPMTPEEIPWETFGFERTSFVRSRLLAAYGPSTVKLTLSALKGVLRTARRLELINHEQFANATDWEKVRGSRLSRGRALSSEEIAKLLAFCRSQADPYGAFLTALFSTLIGLGLRASETCQLTLGAYDADARVLRVLRKGNKEVELAVTEEAAAIDRWLVVRKTLNVSTQWLFLRPMKDGGLRVVPPNVKGLQYLCQEVATGADIKKFSPHDCRRTFGTRLLDQGIDLSTVQRLMSHESPDTTVRYDKRQAKTDAETRARVRVLGS